MHLLSRTEKTMNRSSKYHTVLQKFSRKIVRYSLIAIAALLVLALLIFGIKVAVQSHNDEGDAVETAMDPSFSGIPEMALPDDSDVTYQYLEDLSETPLSYVVESDSYIREVILYQLYQDQTSSTTYTVTKYGEKYRIDADHALRICDGEQLYIRNGIHLLITDVSPYYEEIGVASLADIRSMAENTEKYDVKCAISDNQKIINVRITDESASLISDYEIALESGIVRAERHYYAGLLYKVVMTESLVLTEEMDESLFIIPE